jgi:hypothetical protein
MAILNRALEEQRLEVQMLCKLNVTTFNVIERGFRVIVARKERPRPRRYLGSFIESSIK